MIGRRRGVAPAPPAAFVISLVAIVAGALAGPLAGLPLATAEAAGPPPLQVVGDARYTVEPDRSRVRVSVGLRIENTRSETATHRYWYDRAYLAIQPGATGTRIAGVGSSPTVRVTQATKDHRLLEIGFGRRLYSGQALSLRLSYFMRDPGGAPDRPIRVGPGLVSFPVWAFASDATPGARATVIIPAGFEIQFGARAFASTDQLDSGAVELSTGALSDATRLRGYVVATGEAAFVDATIAVPTASGALDVTVSGWADDIGWRDRMTRIVRQSAPAIAEDTGLAGPGAGLQVQEATSWALGGGAVIWDPSLGRLLVAHDARPPAVIRGLAQAFLTADVVTERWATEGLAEIYAQRAAASMDVAFELPAWDDEKRRLAGPLNAWPGPSPETAAVDAAARATSIELARRSIEALGPDGLRAALGRLTAGTSVYQPEIVPTDGPERAAGPADWRRILDAFEEEGGADFSELWTTFVVRPEEASLLADRRDARIRYEATVDGSSGWALPAAIREALTNWRFESAQALMDGVDAAMARRRSLETTAAGLRLRLPDEVQPLFERGRLDAALAEADAETVAMEAIADTEAAATPSSVLAAIGLWGEEPALDLAAARAAFEDGRLDDSGAAAAAARATWRAAEDVGRSRLAMLGLLIGAGGVLVLVLRARWHGTRSLGRARVDEVARR